MPQFQVNKWLQAALSVIIMGTAILASVQWNQFLDPKTAGSVAAFFAGIKLLTNIFAPGAGVQTTPTGSGLITHKADAS